MYQSPIPLKPYIDSSIILGSGRPKNLMKRNHNTMTNFIEIVIKIIFNFNFRGKFKMKMERIRKKKKTILLNI